MKQCPKCPNLHSKPGIYCCRTCANSRIWSDEDKLKKSLANKGKPGFRGTKRPRDLSYVPDMIAKIWEKTLSRFNNGEVHDRETLRKILTKVRGYKCEIFDCGVSSWLDKPLTLQVDHIDGNAGNSLPQNVRLICPNCHSQTPTFGSRNKGNGRKSRGLSLK